MPTLTWRLFRCLRGREVLTFCGISSIIDIMSKQTPRHSMQMAQLRTVAMARPLVFRADYRVVLSSVDRQMRRLARRLDRSKLPAVAFFAAWQRELRPRLEKITAESTATKLQQALKREVLAHPRSQETLLQLIIPIRLDEERRAFCRAQFSPLKEKRLYRAARQFVEQSVEQCENDIKMYEQYIQYREVAKELGVTVRDPHAGVVRRYWQRLTERRQVRRLARTVAKRQRQIASDIQRLEGRYDGLVARIFALGIDYVTILAARQEYEKGLARLSSKAAKSPAKRLAVFDKKTESLRTAYLDAVPGVDSLRDAQLAAKEVDEVLLAVFDLDATCRNALMRAFQEYRALVREREALDDQLAL